MKFMHVLCALALQWMVASTQAQEFSNSGNGPLEIVFSFDTTGSMSSVIRLVRTKVQELIGRLQSDIPGIRISVFAQSDYGEPYVTKFIDFSENVEDLKNFVRDVRSTSGGDAEEAYERVLLDARTNLTWTEGSRRALVLIGDERPHSTKYRKNKMKVDWREESRNLRDMGVKIYAIQALRVNAAEYFYKGMANITNGYHLRLTNFDNIFNFIMGISYRAFGIEYLELFEEEVKYRLQQKGQEMNGDLKKFFNELKRAQDFTEQRTTITPTRKYKATTPAPPTTTEAPTESKIKVNSLHIRSDIAYRFATTTLESQLENTQAEAQEVTFKVRLPDPAFISNFSMTIDGKTYHAEVKEKEAAKKAYIKAKAEGKTTGHVEQTEREVNSFKVSVNVGGNNTIIFNLMYQELLERRLGAYEHRIYVDPGQIVPDFKIDVFIQESRDLSFLSVPPLLSENINVISIAEENPLAKIERTSSNAAHIEFHPTPVDQEKASASGMQGQFVVQYDVKRESGVGEIQVVDGYFVHYFAPPNLTPSDKNVVFVLDTSGSMHGQKLQQLKDAMLTILNDLRLNDYFNIVSFSSFLRFWKKVDMVQATPKNIEEAKVFVRNFLAVGGTNINDAAIRGMNFLEKHVNQSAVKAPSMVFFMTDGTPTDGESNKAKILENIRQKNGEKFSLFALGFGTGVDFKFLTQLALQNKGFARKIFADSDAALQLQGFYDEVKSPLLNDIKIKYLGVELNESSTTETTFTNYFNGTEIIVCGFLGEPRGILQTQISGQSSEGELVLDGEINIIPPIPDKPEDLEPGEAPPTASVGKFTERLWAYLTIKNLLDEELKSLDADEKAKLKEKALALSLKYHFVTPVTSLLVVKPDEDETAEKEATPTLATPTTTTVPAPDVDSVGEEDYITSETAFHAVSEPKRVADLGPSGRGRGGRGRGGGGGGGGGGRSGGGGGGDPHFLIPVDGLNIPICFDVTGKRGEIYQLLQDPTIGLFSNARIVSKVENTTKTYFGEISLLTEGHIIVVNPRSLKVDGRLYKWNKKVNHHFKIRVGDIVIDRYEQDNITITYKDEKIKLVIVRRLVRRTHPFKVDHLGLFVSRNMGFSKEVHGLIGQFQHLHVEELNSTLTFPRNFRKPIPMLIRPKPNMAKRKWQDCYFAKDQGQGLIKGHPHDYLVADMLSHETLKI